MSMLILSVHVSDSVAFALRPSSLNSQEKRSTSSNGQLMQRNSLRTHSLPQKYAVSSSIKKSAKQQLKFLPINSHSRSAVEDKMFASQQNSQDTASTSNQ